jgi:hypothetical protein
MRIVIVDRRTEEAPFPERDRHGVLAIEGLEGLGRKLRRMARRDRAARQAREQHQNERAPSHERERCHDLRGASRVHWFKNDRRRAAY